MRICKICGITKELTLFYFHKTHNYYLKSCKDCINLKRRTNRLKLVNFCKEKTEKDPDMRVHRKCKICGIIKRLNIDNFSRDRTYDLECRECSGTKRVIKGVNLSPTNIKRRYLTIINACRVSDKRKGLITQLSNEFVKNSLLEPCFYCGFHSTGLDRKDNSIGHIENNCIPCCKECNTARNNYFTVDEMIVIGESIRKIKEERLRS